MWKRARLERALGRPLWEWNGSVDVFSTRGRNIARGSVHLSRKHKPPRPSTKGQGRWLMWDCYKIESLTENYRRLMFSVAREANSQTAKKPLTIKDNKSVLSVVGGAMRSLSTVRRALCCVAYAETTKHGTSNEFVLTYTCPKHASLEKAHS
jgi:hypothetical protein